MIYGPITSDTKTKEPFLGWKLFGVCFPPSAPAHNETEEIARNGADLGQPISAVTLQETKRTTGTPCYFRFAPGVKKHKNTQDLQIIFF